MNSDSHNIKAGKKYGGRLIVHDCQDCVGRRGDHMADTSWCRLDHPDERYITSWSQDRTIPDWCPLKRGDAIVQLRKGER